MSRLIIHIGYPKTATTTLQMHLFEKLDNIEYLGIPFDQDMEQLFDLFIECDKIFYEKKKKYYIELFRKRFNSNKIYLLSNELIMEPLRRGKTNSGLVLERLKDFFSHFFEDIRLVVTLRNQFDLLISRYNQNMDEERKHPSQDSFESFLQKQFQRSDYSYMIHYNFYKVICFLESLYDKSNVSVLFYEEFVSDKKEFLKKWAKLFGMEDDKLYTILGEKSSNVRSKNLHSFGKSQKNVKSSSSLKRLVIAVRYKLFPDTFYFTDYSWGRKVRNLLSFFDKNVTIQYTKQMEEDIKSYYNKSNRKLEKKLSIDLEQYNYPMEKR